MTGWLTPRWSGPHHFSVRGSGPSRVVVDGVDVATLGALSDPSDLFAPFYCDDAGVGSVHLSAGHPVLIEAVMRHEAIGVPLFEVGCREPSVPDRMERAVELAAAAQAVVLVVGTSSDLEAEGRDRTTTALPGGQDALIEAVLDANRRTVVVVNAGSAVDMPWIDKAAAVLYAWFPGHGFAEALAAVLAGDLEPGGRLPLTLAASSDHYPAFSTLPDAQGRRHYHESVLIGYRHFDATGIEPLFAFGHGLGYTTFDYTALVLSTDALSVGQTLSGSDHRDQHRQSQGKGRPAAVRESRSLWSAAPAPGAQRLSHRAPGPLGVVRGLLRSRPSRVRSLGSRRPTLAGRPWGVRHPPRVVLPRHPAVGRRASGGV